MEIVFACLIFFSAHFLQGFSGFGAALVSVPILSLAMDIHQVVPLAVLVGLFCLPYLTWTNRHAIDFRTTLPMIAAGMVGVPIGVKTLRGLDGDTAIMVLGIVMVALVTGQNLMRLQIIGKPRAWKAVIAGGLSGLLGGAFNTAGPPAVVYLHLTSCAKESRASLYFIFFVLGINTLTNQVIQGMTTLATLKLALLAGPCAFIGAYLGGRVAGVTPSDKFKKVVTGFIILLGIYLVTKSLI